MVSSAFTLLRFVAFISASAFIAVQATEDFADLELKESSQLSLAEALANPDSVSPEDRLALAEAFQPPTTKPSRRRTASRRRKGGATRRRGPVGSPIGARVARLESQVKMLTAMVKKLAEGGGPTKPPASKPPPKVVACKDKEEGESCEMKWEGKPPVKGKCMKSVKDGKEIMWCKKSEKPAKPPGSGSADGIKPVHSPYADTPTGKCELVVKGPGGPGTDVSCFREKAPKDCQNRYADAECKFAEVGSEKCKLADGKKPQSKYHKGIGEAKCKKLCNAGEKCVGYSTSPHSKNCLTWWGPAGTPLLGGGGRWGMARCVVKLTQDVPYTGLWANLGLKDGRETSWGQCQMRGKQPPVKVYPKSSKNQCQKLCSANHMCGGFSVHYWTKACKLFLGSPLYGGGKYWGKSGCIVKLRPGQRQIESATTINGTIPPDEFDNGDEMSKFRRRRSKPPPPPEDDDDNDDDF